MSNYQTQHNIKLRISTGKKDLGKVKNRITTWQSMIDQMCKVHLDPNNTLPQYLALSKDEQARIKNQGFFVGGHCDGGIRRISNMTDRYLVTLDVDECNMGHQFDLECGLTELNKYEFFAYSTRKHTPESPRLRIILPLEKPCEGEAYHALSRILASMFDLSMASVDPVSFRITQLMYWPSVCKDAQFVTFHNPGELANAQTILDEFGDWRDFTKLPRSERDESTYTGAGKKPENPETKEGFVGAFCRVYDVPAAIDTFLSDYYVNQTETQQGLRYTYAKGTTSLGAIVYDDGKFLFSNHMHDPAAGHSQNAFDLVRLHLYGDLDQKAKPDTAPMRLPSFKAMIESLQSDTAVLRDLRDQKYDMGRVTGEAPNDDGAFESVDYDPDLDDEPVKTGDDEVFWMDKLELSGESGLIKPTMYNLALILMNDERFALAVRRNQFNSRKVYFKELGLKEYGLQKLPVMDAINGSDWTDSHGRYIKIMLEWPRGKNKPGYGLRATDRDLNDAIDHAADRQAFHPVRDYLLSLRWDGKARVRTLFVDFLGAENTAYHREVCYLTLVGAVTRIFEPGHKFDYMPVLEGAQGKRKSAFIETLARGIWFREMGDINDKNRSIESMSGAWLLEFAELHQIGRSEVNKIKEFLTVKSETSRMAFERNTRTFQRQCVFFGTTNDREYLRDNTGNRRFWPVMCTIEEINIEKLERVVDQVWAEAVKIYQDMRKEKPYGHLPLYLVDKSIAKDAVKMQASRKILSNEEILADQIESWLEQPIAPEEAKGLSYARDDSGFEGEEDAKPDTVPRTKTCAGEVYEKVLGNSRKTFSTDKNGQYLIARAMQLVSGWERIDGFFRYGQYGRQRVMYQRINTEKVDDEL
jgi:putative DNA primase/helicase